MNKTLFLIPLLLLVYCSNSDQSPIANQALVKPTLPVVESDVFNLKVVPEIKLHFSLAEWNKLLQNFDLNPKNEKKVVSNFTFTTNGRTVQLDSIGLKLRGNTSRRRPEGASGQVHNAAAPNWHHSHFAIDFSKFKDAQRFLGLNKINLKWFKDDPTYSREVYCYDLFRRFGCWNAPRSSYCKLTIEVEGDAAPAYFGVYELLESVDEDFIAKNSAQWGAGVGFLWKGYNLGSNKADFYSVNSIGAEFVSLTPSLSQYYAYDLKTRSAELPLAKNQLTEFIANLNMKTGTEFQNWIVTQMDVDLFLKTYATSVVLGMWDDYWVNCNNFYFYFAPNGKAYFIPYDYDNSLGTSAILSNSGTQNPLNWGPASQRPLVTKILAIPQYQTTYKNYVKSLTLLQNDYFTAGKSKIRIMAWQSMIAGFVSNDTGEDMILNDVPAYWGNQTNYRLLSGNSNGGNSGPANFFTTRTASIPW